MTAVVTPWMMLYLATVYCLRDGDNRRVVDALAFNWFVNQIVVMANGGYPVLPIFIAIDFITGLWLATYEGSKTGHRAAWFFIPMMSLNAAAYVNSEPPPGWHYTALFALAWAQIGVVGANYDGFRKIVDRASSRILHPISSALYYFRNEK